jgi:hypothetical protein
MKSRASVLVATATLVVAAFGCQFIVGSEPPPFACDDGKSNACPPGQFCFGGQCIAGSATDQQVTPEAEVPDTSPVVDSGLDVLAPDGGPQPLGGPCGRDKDCASALCGTDGLLGQAVTSTGTFCTSLCCTSAQCPKSFACLATGSGGSYCVPAAAVPDRTFPDAGGGATAGTLCATNTDCRSGLCADLGGIGTTKRCIDSCCADSECASGSSCTVKQVAAKYTGFVCANGPSSRDAGSLCSADNACRSNYCVRFTSPANDNCAARCCASSQCGAGNSCTINYTGPALNDIIQHCINGVVGAARTSCTVPANCSSGICELESNGQADGSVSRKVCRDVCCLDSHCPANEKCTPAPNNPRVLRCVPR